MKLTARGQDRNVRSRQIALRYLGRSICLPFKTQAMAPGPRRIIIFEPVLNTVTVCECHERIFIAHMGDQGARKILKISGSTVFSSMGYLPAWTCLEASCPNGTHHPSRHQRQPALHEWTYPPVTPSESDRVSLVAVEEGQTCRDSTVLCKY